MTAISPWILLNSKPSATPVWRRTCELGDDLVLGIQTHILVWGKGHLHGRECCNASALRVVWWQSWCLTSHILSTCEFWRCELWSTVWAQYVRCDKIGLVVTPLSGSIFVCTSDVLPGHLVFHHNGLRYCHLAWDPISAVISWKGLSGSGFEILANSVAVGS